MSNNKQSSVDSLFQKLWDTSKDKFTWYAILEEHKAMYKQEIDNKVIHFAEWLTKKHTLELMTLYSQFEETFGGNNEP